MRSFCSASLLILGIILQSPAFPLFAQPGTVQANGITIAYESFGDLGNEAIIMIQGNGATMLHYSARMCEELARINIPTMVIHGDADPKGPLEAGKEVAATIPGALLCVINGLGHDISREFVDKIMDCIVKIAAKSKS